MNSTDNILREAWGKVCDGLTFLVELPIVAVALIGAGLLHGAMIALEWLDKTTPEKEEE